MCLTAPNTPTYNLKVVGVYTPEVDNITITIKTHDDEFDMDIDPDALANDVFEEYVEKNTIEFAGEELDMELTIEDNGIEDGANISIIAKEEEIDQASLMENTFKNPTDINTRYYVVNERWYKPEQDRGGNEYHIDTWERNINMKSYITIKKRTKKQLVYSYHNINVSAVENVRCCIYTADDETEYIGDGNGPYIFGNNCVYNFRADHLIKGEDIHMFKGCIIHATDGTHHYNN